MAKATKITKKASKATVSSKKGSKKAAASFTTKAPTKKKATAAKSATKTAAKKAVTKKTAAGKAATLSKAKKPLKKRATKKYPPPPGSDTLKLLTELRAGKTAKKDIQTFLTSYDDHGYTRLMHAAMYSELEVVQALLAAAGDVFSGKELCENVLNLQDKVRCLTALHYAVVRGRVEIAKLLLATAAQAAGKDADLLFATAVPGDCRHSWNPLMFAVNSSKLTMVAMVLEQYKKLLTEKQLNELLLNRDERGELVEAYATRDDIRTLIHAQSLVGKTKTKEAA